MKTISSLIQQKIHVISYVVILLVTGCAVNPQCPDQLLPILEVEINNTASNHDDYVSTSSFIPCRVRIANASKPLGGGQNFPGGVEVELRNRNLFTDLRISPVASGTSQSFFATLPANGDWFNFFIRGNNLSTVDKSAIVEIATSGITCNETVLTRKGLMVTNTPPIAAGLAQVHVRIGSVSHLDDYIGWAPVRADVRWLNPPNPAANLSVTIRNLSGTNRLRFSATEPSSGNTASNSTINLTLSGSGSQVNFWVAGNSGNPSLDEKDAIFEVVQTPGSTLLSREGLMVRVRKNANSLTPTERDRYLEALREVHQTYGLYILFRDSHSRDAGVSSNIASRQAHRGPAFLPWHRAFVLHQERLLQASDPSVSAHYWAFDTSTPGMFSPDFLGSNNPDGSNWVALNPSNPISTWLIPGQPIGIRRRTPYDSNGNPSVANEIATIALGPNYSNFRGPMESNPHGSAHNGSNVSGSGSWIPNLTNTVQDPLFFYLHSNVDRLWAKWQWINDRFDNSSVNSYDLQGSHDSPPVGLEPDYEEDEDGRITLNRTLGQYMNDSMWPWDSITGGTTTAEKPSVAPLTPFPIILGGVLPFSKPYVGLMIDFRLLNISYDDIFPY